MKQFAKTALITGIPYGIIMGLYVGIAGHTLFGFSSGIKFGLVIAVGSGCLFGLGFAGIVAVLMPILRRYFSHIRQEFTDEQVLHDGPANHFRHGEAVGGWLFLTDHQVLFRSHKFNLQPHKLSVPLAEIREVLAVRTLGLVPNGLRLITSAGQVEKFVIEDHCKWRDLILKTMARSASSEK